MSPLSFSESMARFYDALNDGADYASERDLLCSLLPAPARFGLDLGCGTGSLCVLLSEDFEMTGVDVSEQMLAQADEKAFSARCRVRFVCQDITRLSLGAKYDFCLCLHDTLNYLLKTSELSAVFSRVAEHLADGGVFLFDISRPERYLLEYASSSVVLERDGLFCAWEREYHPASRLCDFYFHFFSERSDGAYTRGFEQERQRCYSPRTVLRLCREAGLVPELVRETETHLIYCARAAREEA